MVSRISTVCIIASSKPEFTNSLLSSTARKQTVFAFADYSMVISCTLFRIPVNAWRLELVFETAKAVCDKF
ncbi:MAG: hypothetical protein R3A50_18995 [Saprospiraceae bacterium]